MPAGRATVLSTGEVMEVTIDKRDKKHFPKFIKESLEKDVEIAISLRGTLVSSHEGGKLEFMALNDTCVKINKVINHRTIPQIHTLRGVERFIYWATHGHRPVSGDEDVYWIHEALIEKYSTEMINLNTQKQEPIRTSDPRMTTKIMARIIEGALNQLAMTDIPNEVMDEIGEDMFKLWKSWYDWRYNKAEEDPLHEVEAGIITWEQYKIFHPVCELCGLPESPSDALERIHIISAGADAGIYEKSWNWIHGHHSHHHLQHASRSGGNVGWDAIESSFPHIKGKLTRAKEFAHAKGLLLFS